jgi:hypothetical protein
MRFNLLIFNPHCFSLAHTEVRVHLRRSTYSLPQHQSNWSAQANLVFATLNLNSIKTGFNKKLKVQDVTQRYGGKNHQLYSWKWESWDVLTVCRPLSLFTRTFDTKHYLQYGFYFSSFRIRSNKIIFSFSALWDFWNAIIECAFSCLNFNQHFSLGL